MLCPWGPVWVVVSGALLKRVLPLLVALVSTSMVDSVFLPKWSMSFIGKIYLLKVILTFIFDFFLGDIVYEEGRDHISKIQKFRPEPLLSHLFAKLQLIDSLTELHLLFWITALHHRLSSQRDFRKEESGWHLPSLSLGCNAISLLSSFPSLFSLSLL